jgi:hypothetical protein
MMIDHNILRVVVRGSQESIPGACGLKSVLQDDRRIADGPDLSKSVTVELSDRGLASRQSINLRLVQELDSNDHILVCGLSVFLRDLIQDAHRERHGVAGSPSRGTLKLTRIVEAVLAQWCTVKIYPDLEASLSRPSNGFVEIGCSSLDICISGVFLICPISDRYSNSVKACTCYLLEVCESDPCVPMVFEDCLGIGRFCTEGVLVDDRGIERSKD